VFFLSVTYFLMNIFFVIIDSKQDLFTIQAYVCNIIVTSLQWNVFILIVLV
jgi:hypothetical protein